MSTISRATRPLLVGVYAAALRLLPRESRLEYAPAMLETFTRRATDLRGGIVVHAAFLLRELLGLTRLRGWRTRPESTPAVGPPNRGTPGPARRAMSWPTDLRHAFRRLRRVPVFTAATVITLALAAGGATAIFSVVHSILLSPLPYPDAHRLVAIRTAAPSAGVDDMEMTIGLYLQYREHVDSFASIALYDRVYRNLTADGEPERLETIQATDDFFATLGVEAALGRTLGAVDTAADAESVVVLSNSLWRSRYGADQSVIGRTLLLDDHPFTVVGVMPAGFDFPRPGTDAWTAWHIDPGNLPLVSFSFDAVARLANGATIDSTGAELQRAISTFPEAFGWDRAEWERMGLVGFVRDLKAQTVGEVGSTLWLFAGAGLLVLLLAWANVANLFLVRAEARVGEARIRRALGASRGQLVRYWMAEGLWIALLAALLGLALATAGIDAIAELAPDLPRVGTVGISGPTMAFTALLTLFASLVFGSVPLLGGERASVDRRTTAGVAARRHREILVGVQVAMALTLSIGAALMLQSVSGMMSADPGFDRSDVLTFRISLPSAGYPDREAAARLHQSLVDRLTALPGIDRAGIARCLPLQGWCGGNPVSSPDSPLPEEAFRDVVSVKPVSTGYFETLRIPLLAGRSFHRTDQSLRNGAAVVSEALAARLFPGESPAEVLGKRVSPQSDPGVDAWYTIVGVAASVQRSRIAEPAAEMLYVPLLGIGNDQHLAPIRDVIVAMRTDGPPLAAIDMARAAIRDLDANIPLARIRTLADIHAAASARSRLTSLLLALAAGTGLLLGAIGIYGVVSGAARQRTAEFGVRAALGARAADLLRMVMARGLAVIATGVVAGVIASLAAGRFVASMLYEVEANDPATFIGVITLLSAIGALATWLPARRAARIDPVEALRSR